MLVACLVGALAWAGHGAATPDAIGDVQLTGDVLHLVAAGIWIGGLLPLTAVLVIARRAGDVRSIAIAAEATRHFSTLGVVTVLTLLVSGIVNTYVLAGSVPALVGTPYGRLLLIKIGLFIAMVLIAVFNRQSLTPRLASAAAGEPSMAHGTLSHLVSNSLTELALGLAILAIVGALGILKPGLHDQPIWPFPVRFSTDAFDDPQLRNSMFAAFAAIAISGLLVIGADFVASPALAGDHLRRAAGWIFRAHTTRSHRARLPNEFLRLADRVLDPVDRPRTGPIPGELRRLSWSAGPRRRPRCSVPHYKAA